MTAGRKRRFAEKMLAVSAMPVGFIDVGAGGPLKMPWTLLPADCVRKFDFEPEDRRAGVAPLCASDHAGRERLFVARDPRSSSLHAAAESFVQRFANDGTMATGEIDVDCVTLDSFFSGRWDLVDLLDINAEGHDFRVIQGAAGLLAAGHVSLIRIEVLFTEVWRGQGWFSDIDQFLRSAGYDLVTMKLDFDRPAAVRHIRHEGELLWGKALYAPSADAWNAPLTQAQAADIAEDRLLKTIVLYVITESLGRATELIASGERAGVLLRVAPDEMRRWIRWVFQYAEGEALALKVLRLFSVRRWGGAVARLVTGG